MKNMQSIAENFLKETMTIPDLRDKIITSVRRWWKRTIDRPLSWMETIGSRMSVFAWNKRWGNRERGTGYRDEVE
jgi:hypothetical protein